jgi:hypothetical protein
VKGAEPGHDVCADGVGASGVAFAGNGRSDVRAEVEEVDFSRVEPRQPDVYACDYKVTISSSHPISCHRLII